MNMNQILLAKSQREEDGQIVKSPVSLLDHSQAVLAAARAILDEVEGFLPVEVVKPDLRKLVPRGARSCTISARRTAFSKASFFLREKNFRKFHGIRDNRSAMKESVP